ncbi:MAG TPA: hypothetical protein VLA37_06580, partial [Sphingomonadaceae bacterium]|nr:hypothetical protein [Sphingomonadaceae bacterium]
MTSEVTQDQLGYLLQLSRDAAVQMLGQWGGFPPFAMRAGKDGAVEVVSNTEQVADDQLAEVYERIQSALAEEARQGGIHAAAMVSNVHMSDVGEGDEFDRAIQVHIETESFSRVVLVPYRFPEMVEVKQYRDVETGEMQPFDAPSAI